MQGKEQKERWCFERDLIVCARNSLRQRRQVRVGRWREETR